MISVYHWSNGEARDRPAGESLSLDSNVVGGRGAAV